MTTSLRQGDVLVAGSDGLFDNVDDTALAELITSSLEEMSEVKEGANGRATSKNKSHNQRARAAQTMAQRLSSLAFSK